MVLSDDSLNIVLIGDWNKSYTNPEWIANNVFESQDLEIGINGKGIDVSVSYKKAGVIISPGISQMIFSVSNISDDFINKLCNTLNNFLKNAIASQMYAYGINVRFLDDDTSLFTDMIDGISDATTLIENGYEIASSKLSHTLKNNGKIINMDSELINNTLSIHFNEHHTSDLDNVEFCFDHIKGFIEECTEILKKLGYEFEKEII